MLEPAHALLAHAVRRSRLDVLYGCVGPGGAGFGGALLDGMLLGSACCDGAVDRALVPADVQAQFAAAGLRLTHWWRLQSGAARRVQQCVRGWLAYRRLALTCHSQSRALVTSRHRTDWGGRVDHSHLQLHDVGSPHTLPAAQLCGVGLASAFSSPLPSSGLQLHGVGSPHSLGSSSAQPCGVGLAPASSSSLPRRSAAHNI